MDVFFSTVVRGAPLEQGGELIRLDWQSKEIRGRTPIYAAIPQSDDPNPRGNTRGGRGIKALRDKIIVASYHTLKVFDRELGHLRDVSHPLMVGLHEVYSETDNEIWVCCTAIDAALKVDLKTGDVLEQIWPREIPGFQQALELEPLAIDKQVDNRIRFLSPQHKEDPDHLHLNAVTAWRGEMYALFNNFGAIVNLNRGEIVIRESALKGGHNLVIRDDGIAFVNATSGSAIRIYDLKSKKLEKIIELDDFRWVRTLVRWSSTIYRAKWALSKLNLYDVPYSRPLFVRGLHLLEDHLFVGLSPASILCIDWQQGELIDAYCFSRDVSVCVHGLEAVKG